MRRTAFDKIAPTFAASDTFKIGLNSSEYVCCAHIITIFVLLTSLPLIRRLLPFTPTGANSIAAGFLETYQGILAMRATDRTVHGLPSLYLYLRSSSICSVLRSTKDAGEPTGD